MGRPYSVDLRERVVAAVEKGGMSARQAAAQFGVGASTAIRWVGRARETGSVSPGKMGGHKPKAIAGEHRVWLLRRVQEADFTLRGLVSEFAERGAVKTKQRKTFETWFFPAGQDIEQIVVDRARFLIEEKL